MVPAGWQGRCWQVLVRTVADLGKVMSAQFLIPQTQQTANRVCYKSSVSALQSAEPGRAKVDVGIRCGWYRFALSSELCSAVRCLKEAHVHVHACVLSCVLQGQGRL